LVAKKLDWEPPPLEVAEFTDRDAYAIRSLAKGEATPEQQKLALQWIMQGAGMLTSQSMVFGSPDRTAFNEGRRNVAKQIVHLTVVDLDARKKK
jgi:hypothetical protein